MWRVTVVTLVWVSGLASRLAGPKDESNEAQLDKTGTKKPSDETNEKMEVVVNFTKDDKPGVKLSRGPSTANTLKQDEAGTIISKIEANGTMSKTVVLPGWHVVKINRKDVSRFGPVTVNGLWVEAMNSEKKYTVTFDYEIPELEHRHLLYFGAFPAILAILVTLCGLPCFLYRIWTEKALADPRPADMQVDQGLEEAPKLEPCYLAKVIDHSVTRYTLMIFFLYSLVERIRISSEFMLAQPMVASLDIADAALILGMSIVLEFGRRATQQNPLIVDPEEPDVKDKPPMSMSERLLKRLPKFYQEKAKYARCEAGLAEVMKSELKFRMYFCLPTVLMCFFVVAKGIVIIIAGASTGVMAVVCSDLCYFGLLRISILKFMLDSYIVSSVARSSVDTAVAKLERLMEKLCGDASLKADEAAQETSRETVKKAVEETITEVHLCTVDLAERVLPALQKIGASALGFAVVSWIYSFQWLFSFIATDLDSIRTHPLKFVCEILGIMLTSLPLGLMCLIPPASVSDACDNLLKAINKLRSFETLDDLSLRKIESFIKESNGGQGLGFVLWGTGTVVNRKLLFSAFLKIFALASVFVGFVNTLMKLQSNLQKQLQNVD